MEIKSDVVVFYKCGHKCPHFSKREGRQYCNCPGRLGSGPCYRCGGI